MGKKPNEVEPVIVEVKLDRELKTRLSDIFQSNISSCQQWTLTTNNLALGIYVVYLLTLIMFRSAPLILVMTGIYFANNCVRYGEAKVYANLTELFKQFQEQPAQTLTVFVTKNLPPEENLRSYIRYTHFKCIAANFWMIPTMLAIMAAVVSRF